MVVLVFKQKKRPTQVTKPSPVQQWHSSNDQYLLLVMIDVPSETIPVSSPV